MASTYSTSLKLTLIGDGDQSGIWGQTTNTNLGTLVEQAIAGVATITMTDTNYTLTNFNGVSDESRNAVLVVTGTNSAVRDVIPPVAKKMYTVVNNTSGGFAIRVIGATGTGVSIANGATQVVYCNGTNFVSASGGFVNGAVLGVVGGGTGLSTLTANNVILGNGTSNPTFVAPGSSGNVLSSNGSTWVSAVPAAEFLSGTRVLFQQTSAPTGWTKDTTYTEAALRITSGSVTSGGSVNFSSAFVSYTPTITVSSVSGSAGATTLSTPQMPSHTHGYQVYGNGFTPPGSFFSIDTSFQQPGSGLISSTGGSGSHTHPFSFSSAAASSSSIDLAVKYVDAIICQKN